MPQLSVREIISDIEKKSLEKQISISELCRRAGIARSTYQRWKRMESDPSISMINRLFEVLEKAK